MPATRKLPKSKLPKLPPRPKRPPVKVIDIEPVEQKPDAEPYVRKEVVISFDFP